MNTIERRLDSIHAVNYSLLMDLLGYSQSKLFQLEKNFDELIFSDQLIAKSELKKYVQVTDEEIDQAKERVQESFAQLTLDDVSVVTIKSALYPPLLKKIKRAPLVLFLRGIGDLMQMPCVSVVGSRAATQEGKLRAQKVAIALTENNYGIVSGLAKGIDTAAHTATIKAGGRTIAVVGTPIDKAYPRENASLQEKIAQGHLLISQFPLAQPVSKYNFPQRNYTMCGLSIATVIVEAGETSGALYQAKACIDEGRKLFIMQSLLENKALTWPAKYIDKGAIILKDVETLLEHLKTALEGQDEKTLQLSVFGKAAIG